MKTSVTSKQLKDVQSVQNIYLKLTKKNSLDVFA